MQPNDPRGDDHFDKVIAPRMETDRKEWLTQARAAALRIAESKGTVTADDVHEVCPLPEGVEPRTMGALFHDRRFVRVSQVPGRRSVRSIGVYGIVGKAIPESPATTIFNLKKIVAAQQLKINACPYCSKKD